VLAHDAEGDNGVDTWADRVDTWEGTDSEASHAEAYKEHSHIRVRAVGKDFHPYR